MPQARISVPGSASRGEVIEIKTLIQHPMETGFRRDLAGDAIPVHIIERFIFHPAVAANPYLIFHTVATESGRLEFAWHDDDGSVYTESAEIEVS